MIIPGPDSYLIVYPLSEWLKLEQKIAEKPQFNKKIEEFIRLFMSAGQVCPIDKQGRILIPLPFREYAHLTKEIVWIGMIKRMEIWAKEKWDQTIMNTTPQKLEELKNFIGELGL
jgi:MraZ protein